MLMMLRVGAEPNPDPTRMDTEKNEKTHINTAGYFDWPEIQLSDTSKFTLIFISMTERRAMHDKAMPLIVPSSLVSIFLGSRRVKFRLRYGRCKGDIHI